VRGLERGRALVIPGIVMKLVMLLNEFSPRFVRRAFAGILGRFVRAKKLA
jgi:hypothetical protein